MENIGNINKREGTDGMEPQFNIISGAWNCDYNEIIAALNENPDCINEQDENGLTASHISAALSNYGLLKVICSANGFDPFLQDNFNRRAIDCILLPKTNNIRKILLHKMYGAFPELKNEL